MGARSEDLDHKRMKVHNEEALQEFEALARSERCPACGKKHSTERFEAFGHTITTCPDIPNGHVVSFDPNGITYTIEAQPRPHVNIDFGEKRKFL